MLVPRWLSFGLLTALSGCVNNYIVDDTGGTSGATLDGGPTVSAGVEGSTTSSTDDAGGTGDGDSGAASSSGQPDDTGTTDGTNDGDGDGGSTGGALEACQPCVASGQCGDEFDLCVMLGEPSVCMNRCGEAPEECPPGLSCLDRTSVDGMMAPVCVPDSGSCGSGHHV